jgi:hypothetical protein
LLFAVGLGALMGLIGAAILGRFIYQHRAEPRFMLPAMVLDVWVIAGLAQRRLESRWVLRLRVIRWALLTGEIVWWIPFLIVAFKGFWDLDAYKVLGNSANQMWWSDWRLSRWKSGCRKNSVRV